MNEYDFSPPTEEELKAVKSAYDFSPPTSEEILKTKVAPPALQEDTYTQDVKDLLMGAGQGVTLGFGEEALAAILATIKPSELDWYSNYRAKQKQLESEYQQAQERSPWLTGIGEFAGGFALPVGALMKGAQTAKAAAGTKAFQKAISTGVKAEDALDIAKKAENLSELLRSAKVGALTGGAVSAGSSGETLETPKELLKDIGFGAIAGGAIGGIAQKGIQTTKEFIEESPKLQRALKAFELEAYGIKDKNTGPINLTTEKGQRKIQEDIEDRVKKISDNYLQYFNLASEDLNRKIADSATVPAQRIFNTYKFSSNTDNLFRDEFLNTLKTSPGLKKIESLSEFVNHDNGLIKKLDDTTGQIIKEEINTSDLLNLKDNILRNIKRLKQEGQITEIDGKRISGLINKIDQMINDVNPDILKAYAIKRKMAYPIESLLNDSVDPDTHWRTISKISRGSLGEKKLKDKVEKAVDRKIYETSGTGSRVVQNKVFLENLEKETEKRLKEVIPDSPLLEEGILRKEVLDPKEINRNFKEAYENLGALETTEGMKRTAEERGLKGISESFVAAKTGVPIPYTSQGISQIGGKLGRIEGNFPFVQQPVKKTKDLIKTYGVDKLKTIANQLKNSKNPATRALGESAAASLDNAGPAARAAFLNSIMQNPDIRKELGIGVD